MDVDTIPTVDEPSGRNTSGSRGTRILGGVLAGVGVVSLGVGGYFSWRTKNIESEINNSTVYDSGKYDAGKQASTMQWVFYGAGAGLALTGIILVAAGGSTEAPRDSHAHLLPTFDARSAGLSAIGVF
jgi:hypothetical protein